MSLQALKELARKWGGDIIEISQVEFNARLMENLLEDAPFSSHSLGVDYDAKVVYYSEDDPPPWWEMVHEMGHVFACRERPQVCDEYTFFGWEYAVFKMLGAIEGGWTEAQKYYQIGNGDDFGDLSAEEQAAIVSERVATAEAFGLIVGGKPVAIR